MVKKNSIMLICDYSSQYAGNFIPSLMYLEQVLEERDCSVLYVFPLKAKNRYWYQALQDAGKQLEAIDFNQNRCRFIRTLDRLVRRYHITIIHSHFVPFAPIELYAIINRRVRVFVHIHSDFSCGKSTWMARFKDFLRFRLLSIGVRFLSVSQSMVKMNPGRTVWIPNGLATQRDAVTRKETHKLREWFELPADCIFCEVFGWSPYVKGVDIAVEAVRISRERTGMDIRLGIVCGEDAPTPEWIEQNTNCSGQENYLYYLPATEDVFRYHEGADILISASRSEGFPYSILEMLSLGKCCVISDIPGTTWAKTYDSASFFRSEDASACAEAISVSIHQCKNCSQDTKERVGRDYSIEEWANEILGAYRLDNT